MFDNIKNVCPTQIKVNVHLTINPINYDKTDMLDHANGVYNLQKLKILLLICRAHLISISMIFVSHFNYTCYNSFNIIYIVQ